MCVNVFFNSDVEGSDCTSYIKIMALISKSNNK